MRKGLRWIAHILLVCISMLFWTGCSFFATNTVECAPCSVLEIWSWNEVANETFFGIRTSAVSGYMLGKGVKCKVDGKEQEIGELYFGEDLSVGEHTIVFYTDENFVITLVGDVNGERQEKDLPYHKELTLTVKISPEYADIYDYEYREANGLWIVPTQEDWYQRAVKDWQETRENAFK